MAMRIMRRGLTGPGPWASSAGPAPSHLAECLPHCLPPIKTYEDTLELKRPLGAGHPKTYIACTNPNYRANEPLRRWVQAEPDWSYLELATGHDAMILAPDALSEMLMQE